MFWNVCGWSCGQSFESRLVDYNERLFEVAKDFHLLAEEQGGFRKGCGFVIRFYPSSCC